MRTIPIAPSDRFIFAMLTMLFGLIFRIFRTMNDIAGDRVNPIFGFGFATPRKIKVKPTRNLQNWTDPVLNQGKFKMRTQMLACAAIVMACCFSGCCATCPTGGHGFGYGGGGHHGCDGHRLGGLMHDLNSCESQACCEPPGFIIPRQLNLCAQRKLGTGGHGLLARPGIAAYGRDHYHCGGDCNQGDCRDGDCRRLGLHGLGQHSGGAGLISTRRLGHRTACSDGCTGTSNGDCGCGSIGTHNGSIAGNALSDDSGSTSSIGDSGFDHGYSEAYTGGDGTGLDAGRGGRGIAHGMGNGGHGIGQGMGNSGYGMGHGIRNGGHGIRQGMGNSGYGMGHGVGNSGHGIGQGMGNSGYGMGQGMGNSGYGMGQGMGSSGYGMGHGMGSNGYGDGGSRGFGSGIGGNGLFGLGIGGKRHARVASAGCGRGGCGIGGRLCGQCQNPYGGTKPHTPDFQGPHGNPSPQYAYPYYTTRGPRDFLMKNPPTIGW